MFPDSPSFICHFHFLGDLGQDLLGALYELIRRRLRHHGITGKLRYRLNYLKRFIDRREGLMDRFPEGINQQQWLESDFPALPLMNTYSLILWILEGKKQGAGYGFPFDRTHLSFAQRLRDGAQQLSQLSQMELRGQWRDNKSYHKLGVDLQGVLKDRRLWSAVAEMEQRIKVFDQLRQAMRIAPVEGHQGLNEPGADLPMATIEKRVEKFCEQLPYHPGYSEHPHYQKMIAQIQQYGPKLFADPILVPTPHGEVSIQPQRTNNVMERFFRDFRRGYRRKRGRQGLSKTLQSMLADTPLVKNLENASYRKILLQDHGSLEKLFADIEVKQVREKLAENHHHPEKIPAKIKKIIALPKFPEVLSQIVRKQASA